MTNKEEALRMALDALELYQSKSSVQMFDDAAAAIREVLAQPKQKPFAWLYTDSWGTMKLSEIMPPPDGAFPVYTSPQAKPWVNPSIKEYEDIMLANLTPRTDDERDGIMGALNDMVVLLKEKNT